MKDWLGLVKIMEDGGRLSKMCWEGHRSWWMVVDCPRWARIVKDYGRWW